MNAADQWDQRFDTEAFLYGERANAFLVEHA